MKLVVELLIVASIAMCSGDPVDVNTEEKDSGFHFTRETCPTTNTPFRDVIKLGNKCINMGVSKNASTDSTEKTLEVVREFFRRFCQRKPIIRQCLLEATIQIEVCNNETFVISFNIYRDLIETGLEFGCIDDGERFSKFFFDFGQLRSDKEVSDSITKCGVPNNYMVRIIEESDMDISTKLYILNKVMKTFGECLYQLQIDVSLKDSFQLFADEVINKMKCIRPEDRVLVPCGELDAGLFSVTNVCDLKTYGRNMSLYDVLEEDVVSSFLKPSQIPEPEIINDDMVRDLVSAKCSYLGGIYEPSFVSEMCLSVAQQDEFQNFGDVIETGFEAACHDNGTLFVNVLIGVYRIKNSGHGHAVWECAVAVRSARNESDGHGSFSKNLRFYHELEAFKGCLVNKLGGDVTSVAAATTLIDLTLMGANCVHPEDGATVLCETLVVKI